MKYKVINKTFAPLMLYEVGSIPARGSIVLNKISDSLRAYQKHGKIDIKIIKEN